MLSAFKTLKRQNVHSVLCFFFPSHPERIHQAQAAAAKARKALQQKPKPASKPVGPLPPFLITISFELLYCMQDTVGVELLLLIMNVKPCLCFRSLEVRMEAVKLLGVWREDKILAPFPCRQPLLHPP